MCGIVGAFSLDGVSPVRADLVAQMNEVLRYRGPDDGGIQMLGPVGLGNRRLAIVDRAQGVQPMSNPEGTHWITYNGEVYNYRELRTDLEGLGYRFRTRSDTEVVLRAYEAWGPACVERFNGQFAFAVWDGPAGTLFLARDHLGITPLHYAQADGQFLFASEAKALFAHPGVDRGIDPEAVAEAFLGGTLFGGRSMFRGVRALEPGMRLTVSRRGTFKEAYWDIPVREEQPRTEAEYAEQLLPLLEDALRIRLPDEVPWGLMLSGGTDSSTLVHMALGMSAAPPQTFTIDFPNPWKGKDMDVHYARLLADRLGTRHREFLISPDEYYDLLREVTWHVERPFNKGAVTMYMLYRQIKEHATVVITGEGADELFAGYVGSRGLGLDEVVATGQITRLPWAAYWEDTARLFSADFHRQVRPAELLSQRLADSLRPANGPDPLNNALYLYSKYFLLELLELHDRTSLAFGVEARLPFIDRRYVELLSPMPSIHKYRDGQTKYLFKQQVREFLPAEIVDRSKTPMPIPRDPRTIAAQVALTRELLFSPASRSACYYDMARVGEFLDGRGAFEGISMLTVWKVSMYLITLELLHRAYP
jgi:asparagine synthase (glutamine-hydrolysing)